MTSTHLKTSWPAFEGRFREQILLAPLSEDIFTSPSLFREPIFRLRTHVLAFFQQRTLTLEFIPVFLVSDEKSSLGDLPWLCMALASFLFPGYSETWLRRVSQVLF